MQYIDIFLASSIDDLHNERMELGNYIRILNDMYQSAIISTLCAGIKWGSTP